MTESASRKVKTAEKVPNRLSKLKLAFLYVLIGGLAASAITAVIALLIGHFNTVIGKSLLTIFILFSHSLLILAILWADRYNQVGRLLLPTALFVLVFANLITTILGTWEIIGNDTAWHALGLYFLLLGGVFITLGVSRLRVAEQTSHIALYTTIGLIAATILSLVPWTLHVVSQFDPLYFRIVSALAILSATSFLIALVLRGIAISHDRSLKSSTPKPETTPGGLLAIYIVVGVITSFVWFGGMISFLITGVQLGSTGSSQNTAQYY